MQRGGISGPIIRFVGRFAWPSSLPPSEPNLELGTEDQIPKEIEETGASTIVSDYAKFIFARENYQNIIAASLLTVLGTSMNFLAPYLLGVMVESLEKSQSQTSDSSSAGVDQSDFMRNLLFLVLAYSLTQILPNLRDYALAPMDARNRGRLLMLLTEKQLNKSLDYDVHTNRSDRIYLLQKGFVVSHVGRPLLTQVVPTMMEVTIAIAVLTNQFGSMMGMGAATLLGVYAAYCSRTSSVILGTRERMLETGRESSDAMMGTFNDYKIIHDFNQAAQTLQKVKTKVHAAADAEISAESADLKINIGYSAIPRVAMLAAIMYMGGRVRSGEMAIPELVAYLGYLNGLAVSLPSVGMAMSKVFSSYPDLKFVFGALRDKKGDIYDPNPDVLLKIGDQPRIELKDVTFAYTGKSTTYDQLSLTFEPGETVALVSALGGGKSTLFNLLYRYYLPIEGKIYINGQDISQVGLDSLQSQIGLIGQKPQLKADKNVGDNIRDGAPNPELITDERIYELACQLNVAREICDLRSENKIHPVTFERFKTGLEVHVGTGGISGGQQQIVAVLRGFIKETPIRLLDEVTSALDAGAAGHLMSGVMNLSRNGITILIAHRLAEIADVDRIIVLENGKVIGDGKHEELLGERGCEVYKGLWEEQMRERTPSPSGSEKTTVSDTETVELMRVSRQRSGLLANPSAKKVPSSTTAREITNPELKKEK